MSYTFAPKASTSRTVRGRGTSTATRGATAGRGTMAGRGNGVPGAAAQPGTDQGEKVQRRDGFTMFTPDQKKRDEIAKQAQAEEEKYKKYKDSQKLGTVSYVGTVGGGLSEAGATQQKVQQNRRAAAVNKKTQQNKEKEKERQARLDEDRRRKNEEFLKRFEKGS